MESKSKIRSDRKKASIKEKIVETIEEFNKYRAPEVEGRFTSLREDSFEIEFTGTFCQTCGFYDYFDDFKILLEEFGLMVEITDIKEFDEGALVKFTVKS